MKWKIDPCPDTFGNHTIRPDDGTEHGDITVQPVATVYNGTDALLIAAAPRMLAALANLELRATQARLASNIGPPTLKKADFLRGELARIAEAARAAYAEAAGDTEPDETNRQAAHPGALDRRGRQGMAAGKIPPVG